jgi:hypothetical protein
VIGDVVVLAFVVISGDVAMSATAELTGEYQT